jgi:SAM-dependent methyltransferase
MDPGMNPDNFAALYAFEPGHFWFEPRNALITGLLDKYFPQASSLLEIGCGTGFVLSAIAASRPWSRLCGSELHAEGLAFARTRLPGAEFKQLDARAMPPEDRFDVVGAFDVIEHIAEDEAVLAGIRGALAPGGGLVVTVPQHPWLWSKVDDVSHHARRYTARELHDKIARAGFRVRFSGSYAFGLLPAIIASRLWPRDSAATVKAEFSLPGPANAILRRVLKAEVALTLAGIRFPAGGSRVVVAEAL